MEETTKGRISLLGRSAALSCLKPEQLEELAVLGDYAVYETGQVVFDRGSPCQRLYVIESGEVHILSHDDDRGGQDRVVARFVTGESFGDLDFLARGTYRESAVAAVTTRVLAFPREGVDLDLLVSRFPEALARVFSSRIKGVAHEIRRINALISRETPWIRDLEGLLLHDSLTGVRNRRYLEERLPEETAGEARSLCTVLIKPDNFKMVNDRYGHEEGDRVLVLLAREIISHVPPGATVTRYHGDEFAVVVPDRGTREVREWVDRLREGMQSMDSPVRITLSAGSAAGLPRAPEWIGVVAQAHANMLAARAQGPGSFHG